MIPLRIPFLRRRAMALYPFVFFKERNGQLDRVLLNHEKIHLAQQLEMLILPFYLCYAVNYLYNLIGARDHETAYRNIIFEQEAYRMEKDPEYLNKRRPYSFLRYL